MTIFYGSTFSFGGNFFKTPYPLSRRVSHLNKTERNFSLLTVTSHDRAPLTDDVHWQSICRHDNCVRMIDVPAFHPVVGGDLLTHDGHVGSRVWKGISDVVVAFLGGRKLLAVYM